MGSATPPAGASSTLSDRAHRVHVGLEAGDRENAERADPCQDGQLSIELNQAEDAGTDQESRDDLTGHAREAQAFGHEAADLGRNQDQSERQQVPFHRRTYGTDMRLSAPRRSACRRRCRRRFRRSGATTVRAVSARSDRLNPPSAPICDPECARSQPFGNRACKRRPGTWPGLRRGWEEVER